MAWNFDKLPEEEKARVKDLYLKNLIVKAIPILNKYRVAPQPIKTCCGLTKAIAWVGHAVKTGLI